MIYTEPDSRDACFHFALEEYLPTRAETEEPILLLWRTDKTVMLGVNQVAEAEIDLRAASELGVRVVRRSSGGGTIFTDEGTLLYSILRPFSEGDDVKAVVRDYLAAPVIAALRDFGVEAAQEGRNDILVSDRKICGIAQYVRGGWLCSHGSLLFDTDLERLTRVLKTDDEKIRTKALRSARSRVTNIREHMSGAGGEKPTLRAFWRRLTEKYHEIYGLRERTLTAEDMREIKAIRDAKYANPERTYGAAPPFTFTNARRFAGGKAEIFLETDRGVITSCGIRGDFMSLRPTEEAERALIGRPFRREAVREALAGVDLPAVLGGIGADEMLSLMFD